MSLVRSPRWRRLVYLVLALEALVVGQFAFGAGQGEMMQLTGLDDRTLHFIAFAAAAALAASIWPLRMVLFSLAGAAAAIEAVQLLIPTRQASLLDLLVGGLGLVCGIGIFRLLRLLQARGAA